MAEPYKISQEDDKHLQDLVRDILPGATVILTVTAQTDGVSIRIVPAVLDHRAWLTKRQIEASEGDVLELTIRRLAFELRERLRLEYR